MTEPYRDELAAAHRRIAQLENLLHERRPPAKRRWLPAVIFACTAGGALFVSCAGAFAIGAIRSASRADVAPRAVAPASPQTAAVPKQHLWASWYPQAGVLPAVVDVDGDGTKDIVGLLWRSGDDAKALYVGAFDGASFELKWSAGPYPSQWQATRTHLTVAGDKVVVTDSQDDVHVLSLATGATLLDKRVDGGIVELCVGEDEGKHTALVRVGEPNQTWPIKPLQSFDPATGELSPSGKDAMCTRRERLCAPGAANAPCFTWGTLSGHRRPAGRTTLAEVERTLVDGPVAIAIGRDRERAAVAQAVSLPQSTPLWHGPLVAAGDVAHYGIMQHEHRGGRLVTFYQTKQGPFRLVARDAATGSERWRAIVPGSAEGSYASAWGIEDRFVLVVIGQRLHVFDTETGAHLHAIDSQTT